MDELEELSRRALAWADDDCDPVTAEQCRQMARRCDWTELRDHFGGRLEFGTAGLRAKVGPGPWRMNRSTVRRASRAVAEHLSATCGDGATVVVAFDARQSSADLAAQTCGTLSAAGIRVQVFTRAAPTPLAAFALLHERADAAIVITASHNPKDYNGFKLYGRDGSQIVPPVDSDVARRMDGFASTLAIPCVEYDVSTSPDAIPSRVTEAYFAALRRLCPSRPRRVRIAYTPLHGVGAPFVERALDEAGFTELAVVENQREPDPEFPTVPFPNPEERGVMDAVFSLAEQVQADVALANDPDVDRLAVGIPDASGRFVQLSGNQVGVLLADFLLGRRAPEAAPRLVVESVVSTPLLRSIAAAHGASCERTLTGFKWISRPAIERGDAVSFVLGFEEAIGYAVLPEVRDKDGISAALLVAELADSCAEAGTTLSERLHALYLRHGLWVSAQHNVVSPGATGAARLAGAMDALRCAKWTELDGHAVSAVTDYAVGADARPPWLGKANLVELELGDVGRVLVRPSGTEPKLKIYVDIRGQAPTRRHDLRAAEAELLQRARALGLAVSSRLGLE